MPRPGHSRAAHGSAALLALSATLLALASCRGAESLPQRHTLIDSRDTYDPRSLDPALSTDVPTGRAVAYVFDGLTRFTPEARLEPSLAERWDVSQDGLTYTMHLRSGVKFSDGSVFRARNVTRSWQRVLDPATRGGRGWPLYPIRGAKAFAAGTAKTIDGLTAIDDSTLRITLDTALAIFPKLLAMPVASIVPDSVAQDFGEHPVGTGPWRLVTWKRDDYLLFAKNSNYFGGAPKTDSLLARIIPEPSTGVAEFESGRVDLLYIPESETRQWERTDAKSATLVSAPALRLWYVAINTTRGPLTDARVRQALNLALDRGQILDRLMGGRGRLAAGVIPPSLDGADTARAPYPHDVAKAKALLTAAGHPAGIDVELWLSTDANFTRVAQAMQSNLAEAGIRVKIVQRDAASVREAARKGSTDLHLKDWYADYPDAENFLYPLLHGANRGVGGNESFYQNPAYDELVTASRREQSDAKRAALYRQADALQFADAPMIYLFFYNELFAVQPWIKGFKVPTIFNGQRWTDVLIAR
ncbi:MAG: ABC transporter substrate-binding protein [Gemmatimonadota bacterium]|nr:ABC transporter substrate-binding protein [Gemmatimonadota bacterium]